MEDEFVQFAQKALIIKDNKLLLIRKSAVDIKNPYKWELPGGRKQVGEDVDQHIKREVFEEVGLTVEPKEIFDIWNFTLHINEKPFTVVAVARFCDLVDNEIKITEDIIDNYKWVEINGDLLKYDLISGIKKPIKKLVELYSKN